MDELNQKVCNLLREYTFFFNPEKVLEKPQEV